MIHGFLRVCTLSPSLRVADCPYNAKMTVEAMRQAAADGAQLAVFPELGLTGYTCSDLFLQPLQRAAEEALRTVLETSKTLALVTAVGLPVNVDGKLYNCAAIVCRGRLLGLVPKTYIPNYGEFYERRHFSPAPSGVRRRRCSARSCCSAAAPCRNSCWRRRSARISGRRCLRARRTHWPARPSL